MRLRFCSVVLLSGLLSSHCAPAPNARDVVNTEQSEIDTALRDSIDELFRDEPIAEDVVAEDTALPDEEPVVLDAIADAEVFDAEASADVVPVRDVVNEVALDARDSALMDVRSDAMVTMDVAPESGGAVTFRTESRMLRSGTVNRTFLAVLPTPMEPLPALVLAFHGDGGTGAGFRRSYPIETAAGANAVVLFLDAPGGTFEYYTYEGRTREAAFVQALIDDSVTRYGIDRTRVFLTGFSGGATMVNALNCRLGATVVRGVGINSGTLYPTTSMTTPPRSDFGYTANGGADCAIGLAPAVFVWGVDDRTSGVRYTDGVGTRDNYLATQQCMTATDPAMPSPCVRYRGCRRAVQWCAIPGMAHALWPMSTNAVWSFFRSL